MTQAMVEDVQKTLQETATSLGVDPEQFKSILDAVARGATMGDILGVDKDSLEAGYAYAYNLYAAGNYADAETLFRGLCLYEPDDIRFWMGLGGSLQGRGAHEEALKAYAMANECAALQDPRPMYHCGVCLMRMGNAESAAALFEAAVLLGSKEQPEHVACHARCRAMLEALASAGVKAGEADEERKESI